MNKKELKIIAIFFVVVLQIFLVINSTIANSYLIGTANGISNEGKISFDGAKIKDFVKKGFEFLVGFFSISQIGTVSAEEADMYCCPETKEGFTCLNVFSIGADDKCAEDVIPLSCEATEGCSYGCCVDPVEGVCSTMSPKSTCQEKGGEWKEGSDCDIYECQRGCCVLGDAYKFINENECGHLSEMRGYEIDFRADLNTEASCLGLKNMEDKVACILDDSRCIYTTTEDCLNRNGRPFPGYFCSDEELEDEYGYDYVKHDHRGCLEGEENIYWFDSAGNPEEVAQECKDTKERCDTNSNGAPYCKSLDCTDEYFYKKYGRQPMNGESWCIYEGKIDNGKASVGSEHWYAECVDGEVNGGGPYQLCGNYRSEVCAERLIEEGSKSFSIAKCVANTASECSVINEETPLQVKQGDKLVDNQEGIDACQENKQCEVKQIKIGDSYNFKFCLPRYPKGADLNDGMDDNLCEFDFECKAVWEKKNRLDDWDCISNCECQKNSLAEKMNEVCYSMGDCGTYINYIGKGTDNIEVVGKKGHKLDDDGNEKGDESGSSGCYNIDLDEETANTFFGRLLLSASCPHVSWKDYISNRNTDYKQHAEFPAFDKYLSQILPSDVTQGDYNSKALTWAAAIPGAIGGLAHATYSYIPGISFSTDIGIVSIGTLAQAATVSGVGALIGYAFTKIIPGVSGKAATASIIGGGVAGFAAYFGGSPFSAGGFATTGFVASVFTVLFWVGIALFIGGLILGGPSYETRVVEFSCQPWAPPQGGDDCEKCNENPDFPCTKYRCESLGTMCEFLDDGSQNPPCVSGEIESNPPVISAKEVLTPNYEFKKTSAGAKIEKDGGGCIPQNNELAFVLETDEYAQCKWSSEQPSKPSYDEMIGFSTEEGTLWSKDHTIKITAPEVASLDSDQIKGSYPEREGNIEIYVKCRDRQNPANFNIDEFIVNICIDEEDTDPVYHELTIFDPPDGSYLQYKKTEQEVDMWINEPAECRYDKIKGRLYEDMNYSFECKTGVNQRAFYGWPCKTTLTDLKEGENTIYIRCLDQPWLAGENASKRKVNDGDKSYTLKVTKDELKIDYVKFTYDGKTYESGDTIKEGHEPISLDMNVKTSGGAEEGVATCKWGVEEDGGRWVMYNTYDKVHSQILTPRFSGTHVNYIFCSDEAGNNASAVANFTLELDSEPPEIVRAYHSGAFLKIKTDEPAICYYSQTSCLGNIENMTKVDPTTRTDHEFDWDSDKTYYIKCEDTFGRANSDCLIFRPSEII